MVMLLKDFGPYRIIFMKCVFTTLEFSTILEGKLSRWYYWGSEVKYYEMFRTFSTYRVSTKRIQTFTSSWKM
jgi:hypothetical protein